MTQIRPSSVCREASQGCYSNLKPLYFFESLLRVYTKKAEFAEIIQEGYNAILGQLQHEYESGKGKPSLLDDNACHDSIGPGERAVGEIASPLATAPTTPKTPGSGLHSRNPSFTIPSGVGVSEGTPFARNRFTEIPKNSSVSPPRTGTAMRSEPTPITCPSPSPAAGKRKRLAEFEIRHEKESSQRSKKKR